jgi:hypothetical protein
VIGLGTTLTSPEKASRCYQNQNTRDQREPDPAAAKLFQNLTVGSRIGHPDLIR